MYCQHFGLKKKPFQISSDNEFLWLGEKHAAALTMLKKGLTDDKHCLLALIGDIGTGKTTIINEIIHTLDNGTLFVKIENPCFEMHQLLLFIARAFGFENRYNGHEAELNSVTAPQKIRDFDEHKKNISNSVKNELFCIKEGENFSSAFRSFLESTAEQNKKVLVIVDEAQAIPEQFLNEIVSWSEFGLNNVLTVIFAGQLELQGILKTGSGQVIKNEKIVKVFLKPLDEEETRVYIRKRLEIAGTTRKIFLISAIHEAYIYSKGVPRLINISCDQALVAAFAKNIKIIDVPILKQVLHELALPTNHELTLPKENELEPSTGHGSAIPAGVVEKELSKRQPEKKLYSENMPPAEKQKSPGLVAVCLICLCIGIGFLFYTGFFSFVMKNVQSHHRGNIQTPGKNLKKADVHIQTRPTMGKKSVTPAFPEKIIVTIPKTTYHPVQDIGLGYTPYSSETSQLPAMADKIPASSLKRGHAEGQDLYPGNTSDHSYKTEKISSSAPVKNIRKKHRTIKIKPGTHGNSAPRKTPEPGAIIDWLIKRKNI